MRLPPTPRAPRLSPSGRIVLFYTGMALVGVLWGAFRGHADIYHFGARTPPSRMLLDLGVGFAFGLAVVALTRLAVARLRWARTLHTEFRNLLGPLSSTGILLLALASAVGEECFFRGALVPHVGIIASSVLFALPHIGPGARFLPWTASSFLVGLCMGALFVYGGDLGGPIAAHFTINFLNLHHITNTDLTS